MSLTFSIQARDGDARAASVTTAHGTFQTPTFMAVGTLGGVKTCTPDQVAAAGIQVMLSNTYHLMVRPGAAVVADLGGLHRFANWAGPMLTDSGGYQVFSLAKLGKTTESGVTFNNHVDGTPTTVTPESCMEAQRLLGADLVMQFDDVPALPSDEARVEEAMKRSLRWARRCKEAFTGVSAQGSAQTLLGIQQGGLNDALRQRSIDGLQEIDFDAYAIGGLSVGETKEEMYRGFATYAPMLPDRKLRYVMGIGYPEDLLAAIASGVDMMDCVLPTRSARHGLALTSLGRVQVKNQRHERDETALDPACGCYTCRNFSRGYLRHMWRSGEALGMTLLTIHNLAYYADLMKQARHAIIEQRFSVWRATTEAGWNREKAEEHG